MVKSKNISLTKLEKDFPIIFKEIEKLLKRKLGSKYKRENLVKYLSKVLSFRYNLCPISNKLKEILDILKENYLCKNKTILYLSLTDLTFFCFYET